MYFRFVLVRSEHLPTVHRTNTGEPLQSACGPFPVLGIFGIGFRCRIRSCPPMVRFDVFDYYVIF